jgi:hypothetical protein
MQQQYCCYGSSREWRMREEEQQHGVEDEGMEDLSCLFPSQKL